MKDLHSKIKAAVGLSPAARTATANGTGVDRQGYESVELVIDTGVITDGTHTITIQDSDDNSTFAAIAADDALGGASVVLDTTASDDNAVFRLGYRGTKRYVRATTTVSGATTGGIYGATFLLGHGRSEPVANQV